MISLCITQITSWGVLFYAFPVLAPAISDETGWSLPTITWAFSLAQITSSLTGIAIGPWLDRRGPRTVMTAGSIVAVPALLGIAYAPGFGSFMAAWAVAGTTMAATFYPPAFAALTRWYGPDRVRALTAVTLVGGLASTVFAPLTAALNDAYGWRGAYAVLAIVLGVITIPLHLNLRLPWPSVARTSHSHDRGRGEVAAIARSRPFLMLTLAMTFGGFGVYAVVINQVPLFNERGLDTWPAAWALSLGGVGQVMGRLGYPALSRRTGPRGRTVAILAAAALATLAMGLVPGPAALLIVAAMLVGMTRGVFTLLQATSISDRWGIAAYARLNGLMAAPLTTSIALAPWAGSIIAAAIGGYPTLFVILAATTAVGAVFALATRPTHAIDPSAHRI